MISVHLDILLALGEVVNFTPTSYAPTLNSPSVSAGSNLIPVTSLVFPVPSASFAAPPAAKTYSVPVSATFFHQSAS